MSTRSGRDGAVFLDKDGTLIVDAPYNVDPELVVLAPGAGEGLRLMRAAGLQLVVATNQSGIARGMFGERDLGPIERRIRELLAEEGVVLDGFYWCPHHPDGVVPGFARECECRKPRSGLLRLAAGQRGLALTSSWLVGDILDDVEAGNAAGCTTVLVDNGNETEWVVTAARTPDFVVSDLAEAGRLIAETARGRSAGEAPGWGRTHG